MPIVSKEVFDSAIMSLFPEIVGGGYGAEQLALFAGDGADAGVDDPILSALAADPMRLEEIIALFADGDDPMAAATRVMAHVSLLEGAGVLTRFPDGRFGAVG
mgnify:FL=1